MKIKKYKQFQTVLIKSPDEYTGKLNFDKKIFLAGTIDMGNSYDWQNEVTTKLTEKGNYLIFNPRRDNWNSEWEQSIENKEFKQQVDWELDHLDESDIILMVFLPESKSPITLLELGLYANTGKVIVYCPDGFYRKGNVDIVCERYSIPMAKTIDELIDLVN